VTTPTAVSSSRTTHRWCTLRASNSSSTCNAGTCAACETEAHQAVTSAHKTTNADARLFEARGRLHGVQRHDGAQLLPARGAAKRAHKHLAGRRVHRRGRHAIKQQELADRQRQRAPAFRREAAQVAAAKRSATGEQARTVVTEDGAAHARALRQQRSSAAGRAWRTGWR
jgi:hypothetical protein